MSAIRHLANRGGRAALLLGLALLAVPATSPAETYTWSGASGDSWGDASKWFPATGYPQAGDTAVFTNVGTTVAQTVNLGVDRSVETLVFAPSTAERSFTLSGNTLYVGAGGITKQDGAWRQTISSAVTLTADATFSHLVQSGDQNNQRDFTFGGIVDTAGHALTLAANRRYMTFNGRVTGSGPFAIRTTQSDANVYLRGAGTDFTAPLTVTGGSGGTVYVDGSGTLTATPSIRVERAFFTLGQTGGSANRIPDTASVSLANIARLGLIGQNSATTTETMGSIGLDHGPCILLVDNGTSGTAVLQSASLDRHATGRPVCFVFTSSGYNLGTGGKVVFADGGASLTQIGGDGSRTTNRKIVPYLFTRTEATEPRGRTGGFTDMVYYDSVNGLTQMDRVNDYVNGSVEGVFPAVNADGNDNVRLPYATMKPTPNVSSTVTLAADVTVNSLLFYNDYRGGSNSGWLTIDGSGRRLTIKSGLILGGIHDDAARLSARISVSELDFGAAEGVVIMPEPHYGAIEINSALLGSNGLTLHVDSWGEEGSVSLGGDNSGLTGPYTVSGGSVRAKNAKALGDGTRPLVLSHGTLHPWVDGNLTVASISGVGLVESIWKASGRKLNIGGAGTDAETDAVKLLAGGSIRPGFEGKNGTIQIRDFNQVKLLDGSLELDVFSTSEFDKLLIASPDTADSPTLTLASPASLSVVLAYLPQVGDTFLVVAVDDANPVSGQFAEGTEVEAEFDNKKVTFDVLYNTSEAGGDGNDIALRVADVASLNGATVILLR